MAVKPLPGHVLIKPRESATASGIYLPESSKEAPARGEVIAVGPSKRLDNGTRAEMSIHKGDLVLYGKYAGTEVKIRGQKHLILQESELLEVIDAGHAVASSGWSEKNRTKPPKPGVSVDDAGLEDRVRVAQNTRPQIPDASAMSGSTQDLSAETSAYKHDFASLLISNAGQYVVYLGGQRLGCFATYSDALSAGYDATLGQRPFLACRVEIADDEASTWELGRAID